MNLWFSIILISICAVFWDIGVVFQKKAADEIPKLEVLKHAGKSLGVLLRSSKWVVFIGAFLLSRFTAEEIAEKM